MDVEQFLDQPKLGYFIDGKFIVPSEKKEREFISPVTGKAWKTLVEADQQSAQQAIEAAKKAFHDWKQIPSPVRGGYLRKIGDLMNEYKEDFANVMAMEMGKPVREGLGEVAYASGYFHWFAGEAERIFGQTIPSQYKGKWLMILREPVGVCAAITPWNFPLAVPARKIAPALAAGCTIVVKPSPETPVSLLLLAHICNMAELPKGVVNIIDGPEKEIGQVLLDSPIIRKLTFTGSTQVGRYLYRHSSQTLKKLTLELGGHAPLIVFDDADLDKAVEGTIGGKFRNNGQTCVSPNRIFVQDGIYDTFVKKFVDGVKRLRIGNPLDPQTELSHVLHPESVKKVKKHIQDAIDKGAKAELQGKEPYEPTILIDVTPDMIIFREETFGPVAPIIRFKSDEEGIALANDSEFGLSSYVFTESLSRAIAVMEKLEYGIIGLNDGVPSAPQASFGGIKSSGFGREGGPTAIQEYLNEKFVSIRGYGG